MRKRRHSSLGYISLIEYERFITKPKQKSPLFGRRSSAAIKLLSNHTTGHKPAITHPWRCWNRDCLSSIGYHSSDDSARSSDCTFLQ